MLTAAGSSRRFTTGNSCNICHMCSHHQQSRKLLGMAYIWPAIASVAYAKRSESSGHSAALRPQIKASGAPRWDDCCLCSEALVKHAELCSHSLFPPLGMRRILSPVKHHPACLSRTGLQGCYRKDPLCFS